MSSVPFFRFPRLFIVAFGRVLSVGVDVWIIVVRMKLLALPVDDEESKGSIVESTLLRSSLKVI